MFGIGGPELLLILLIALIVLGPERMPKVARDIGRVMGDLRRTSDELRSEFLNADKLLEAAAKKSELVGSETSAPAAPPALAAPREPEEPAFDREMREARERIQSIPKS